MTIRSGHNTNIGFSGFDNMISDISDDLSATSHTPKPKALSEKPSATKNEHIESRPKKKSPTASNNTYLASSSGLNASSFGKFLIFLVVIISIILVISENNKSDEPTLKYTPSTNSYKKQPAITVSRKPVETKPPYGTNKILNREQIRYCLAQGIRIDAIGEKVNNYSTSEIDKSNALVNDYNSRCATYRYRSGVQSGAQRDINKYKSTYTKEGYAILQSWRGISPVKKKPVKVDQTVLSIQKRLLSMGYDPGVADGIMGKNTRKAIKLYQKIHYLEVDGKPTWALLMHMIEKSNR